MDAALTAAMEKRLTPFVSDIVSLAQKLVSAFGVGEVKVNFWSKEGAARKGDQIFLPNLKSVDWRSSALLRGYLLHEVGHVRHTELPDKYRLNLRNKNAHGIWNSLEDVRQENLLIERHGGARRVLDDVALLVLHQELEEMDVPEDSSPGEVARFFQNWLLFHARCYYRRQSFLSRQVIVYGKGLESIAGRKLVDDAKQLLADYMPKAKSSADCYQLAMKLVSLIVNENGEDEDDETPDSSEGESGDGEPEANSDPADDDGDQNKTATGESSPQADESDEDGSDSEVNGAEPEASLDSAESQSTNSTDSQSASTADCNDQAESNHSGSEPGMENGQQQPMSLSDALDGHDKGDMACIGHAIEDALSEEVEKVGIDQVATGHGSESTIISFDGPDCGDLDKPPFSMVRDYRPAISEGKKLGSKLAAILKGMEHERILPARSGARLRSSALARYQFDDNLFLANEEVERSSVEIGFLIDLSSSMSSVVYELRSALAKLYGASKVLGMPTWMVGFRGESTVEILSGNESDNKAILRIGHTCTFSTTPTGPAVCVGTERLSRSKADQKYLVILTDGQPDNMETARHRLSEAVDQGINVCIIGMDEEIDTGMDEEISFAHKYLSEMTKGLPIPFHTVSNVAGFHAAALSVFKAAATSAIRSAA
jgi:Mg-chelatase subunit ChlD